MTFDIFLLIYSIVITGILAFSIYFNIKHGKILIDVQDVLEESLETLDNRYDSMSKILKVPLFYDSPQVRAVVRDIDSSRRAVLSIANALTGVTQRDEEVEIEEKEN
jgi:hypothetical protein